jgi:hypothetical protein
MADETVKKLEDQLKVAEGIMKQATTYIASTQPVIDEYNAFSDRFVKRAHQVVAVLADRGILAKGQVNAMVDKLASDKVNALDLLEKIASLVRADNLGGVSDITKAASAKMDPFEKLAMYGDSNANTEGSTGLVD